MANTIVLIHGYSDKGDSFAKWHQVLANAGYDVTQIYVGNYVSLSNEVTIKDIAEGFDRALKYEAGLDPNEPFDAIVHSTGMLVIRSWLTTYATEEHRKKRLRRLIALAPASFGSPLAHKGRSWLGAVFKGSKAILRPDFLEAGNEVLSALELGSAFTWDLAHKDLIGENAIFSDHEDSPFVFTFCGNRGYKGLSSLINPDGSDGTVRWAGCPLNTRKITIKLLEDVPDDERVKLEPWGNPQIPLIPIDDADHGSILREPSKELIALVVDAFKVNSRNEFTDWVNNALEKTKTTREKMRRWQQFVVRVVDERGDPVSDWNMQLCRKQKGSACLTDFDLDVHVYEYDKSLRCFHVDLDHLQPEVLEELHMKLIATTGTELVCYYGKGSERFNAAGKKNPRGKWDAQFDLSPFFHTEKFKFFYPFTTTLVEIRLNREPMPLGGRNNVFWLSSPK